MGSRTITKVVTSETIALNAFIYGYAGHSLVTPHAPLNEIWWTDERIDAKVTKGFIRSRLRADERDQLKTQPSFADGLTDDTYMDWILEKARRLFLILVEVGVPDQIFGIIDDSWDDEDLPIPMANVARLALSYENDEKLNLKFYQTQSTFLLRELRPGAHITYAPNEVIPLEYVHKVPPAVALQSWSRVHLPKKHDEILVRRRIQLGGDGPNAISESAFLADVRRARLIRHDHIAPIFASYTAKSHGYTITQFVGEHTLRSFIDHRTPAQLQKLSKSGRNALLLEWMHCLVDAVATIHRDGLCHTAIRPANILIDPDNNIAFSDVGCLKSFQVDKKLDCEDAYNYSAPEHHTKLTVVGGPPPAGRSGFFAMHRKNASFSDSRSFSSGSMSSASSRCSNRPPTETFFKDVITPPLSPTTSTFPARLKRSPPTKAPLPDTGHTTAQQQSDVFSLGCTYLDILSFMLKRKPNAFPKHRSTKHKKPARIDASFHANLDKVSSWIDSLEDAAFKESDLAFIGVPRLLHLIHGMLCQDPALRPTAAEVRNQVFHILISYSGLSSLHCGASTIGDPLALSPVTSNDSASTGRNSEGRARSVMTLRPEDEFTTTLRPGTVYYAHPGKRWAICEEDDAKTFLST